MTPAPKKRSPRYLSSSGPVVAFSVSLAIHEVPSRPLAIRLRSMLGATERRLSGFLETAGWYTTLRLTTSKLFFTQYRRAKGKGLRRKELTVLLKCCRLARRSRASSALRRVAAPRSVPWPLRPTPSRQEGN